MAPQSPNLFFQITQCDILKERVYSQGVCKKAELRERIIAEFVALDSGQ